MKEFKINDAISVICEFKNTRNGFKHVATLLINQEERDNTKVCYLNRTWERYEYETVCLRLIEKTKRLTDSDKENGKQFFNNYLKTTQQETAREFKTIASVAMLGEVFGKSKQDKNDWKLRMLKAGMQNKGLSIPEDWNTLSENEKENRLNKVLEFLKEE